MIGLGVATAEALGQRAGQQDAAAVVRLASRRDAALPVAADGLALPAASVAGVIMTQMP